MQGFRIFTSDISVCELVEFLWGVKSGSIEGVTEICQCICWDLVLNMGAPVVRLKRLQNGRCFINEVDDHRLRLIWEYSVQPRQCLHCLDTREFAINIHRT